MNPKKDDMAGGKSRTAKDSVPHPRMAALETEAADLRAQVEKLTDLAARAQADLQNARVRLERDAQDLRTFAAESVLQKLLPTIDNFQRAFQHLPAELQAHEWVKGVRATEQELLRHLSDLGLQKMAPLGQPVDPRRHEILLVGPGPADTVTEVLEDGYELRGKVLHPAKVRVGNGSPMPQPAQPGA